MNAKNQGLFGSRRASLAWKITAICSLFAVAGLATTLVIQHIQSQKHSDVLIPFAPPQAVETPTVAVQPGPAIQVPSAGNDSPPPNYAVAAPSSSPEVVPAAPVVAATPVTPTVVQPATPAPALADVTYFQAQIPPDSGQWIHEGGCWYWRPTVVIASPEWQPYCDGGHWVNTEQYGWYWESDYPWGWAAFHFGRWFHHPHHGWVWQPDRVWGPGWVCWRHGGDYCGWAPLPPGVCFVAGVGFTIAGRRVEEGCEFGLRPKDYCFIESKHFEERNYRAFVMPMTRVVEIHHETAIIHNTYVYQDRRIVNTGIEVRQVERAVNRRIMPVAVTVQIPRGEIKVVTPPVEAPHHTGPHPVEAPVPVRVQEPMPVNPNKPGVVVPPSENIHLLKNHTEESPAKPVAVPVAPAQPPHVAPVRPEEQPSNPQHVQTPIATPVAQPVRAQPVQEAERVREQQEAAARVAQQQAEQQVAAVREKALQQAQAQAAAEAAREKALQQAQEAERIKQQQELAVQQPRAQPAQVQDQHVNTYQPQNTPVSFPSQQQPGSSGYGGGATNSASGQRGFSNRQH